MSKCGAPGCGMFGIFGHRRLSASYRGENVWCKAHKTADMVNVKSKKCTASGCAKLPSFGYPPCDNGGVLTSTDVEVCADHFLPGMVSNKYNPCEVAGCGMQSVYGTPPEGCGRSEKYAARCKVHRDPDMRSMRAKTCQAPGCYAEAYYGPPGLLRRAFAKFCRKHKTPDMIRLQSAPGRSTCVEGPACKNAVIFSKRDPRNFNTVMLYCKEHIPAEDRARAEADIVAVREEKLALFRRSRAAKRPKIADA